MEYNNTPRPVVAIHKRTHKVYKFDSIGQACKVLGVNHSEVWRCLQKERYSSGGYRFEDVDEYLKNRGIAAPPLALRKHAL